MAGTVERLTLAGYARRRPDAGEMQVELTEHARDWIERIWAPLREEGGRLLGSLGRLLQSCLGARACSVAAFDGLDRLRGRLDRCRRLELCARGNYFELGVT